MFQQTCLAGSCFWRTTLYSACSCKEGCSHIYFCLAMYMSYTVLPQAEGNSTSVDGYALSVEMYAENPLIVTLVDAAALQSSQVFWRPHPKSLSLRCRAICFEGLSNLLLACRIYAMQVLQQQCAKLEQLVQLQKLQQARDELQALQALALRSQSVGNCFSAEMCFY